LTVPRFRCGECLPRLITLEEASSKTNEPPPLDRRLGGHTIQLLTTACEYALRRETRTVAVDELRSSAGIANLSDVAYQRHLIDLRNSGAVALVGEPPYRITVSVGAFDWFARQKFTNYEALRAEFDALIEAAPRIRSNAVADHLHVPLRLADHLFEQLGEEGSHRVTTTSRGEVRIKGDWEL
jgi:hypothetical protein